MKAEDLLNKHGICTECGQMYSHHLDEPFASCGCGTSEWYDYTPYMQLENELAKAKRKIKELEGKKS